MCSVIRILCSRAQSRRLAVTLDPMGIRSELHQGYFSPVTLIRSLRCIAVQAAILLH